MGGCQNYGPFLGTRNIRGRIIIGTQKGTIISTTTHIDIYIYIHMHMGRSLSQSLGGQDPLDVSGLAEITGSLQHSLKV